MLMEVKNQIKIVLLSTKYALQREMLNKVTFFSNIIFMILNNASFIVQWIILFSLKEEVGGYTLKQVLLLWGFAASTFGISRFFFKEAFNLTETINTGKLDAYLIQPKNVLISCITSSVEVSAIGDLLYGFIMLFVYGLNLKNLLLFTLFSILGGLTVVSISVIYSSLTFWFGKVDIISNTANSLMINFATYPDGIFKGFIRLLFYTILPIGFVNFLPIKIMTEFNLLSMLIILFCTIFFVSLAFIIFYRGLRKYSSSNLMNVRM